MLRIAHVVSTFSPQLGGMGVVCENEARAMVEQGHDVTVFTLQYSGSSFEQDVKLPFKVVRLKPIIKLGDAGLVPQLLWKIGKNFDVVHLHYPFYGGAEWLNFIGAPLVITYHMDVQAKGIKYIIQKIYDAVWPKSLFAKAKKIITVDSEFNNSKFLKNILPTKIVEISNGVDTDLFKPEGVDLESVGLSDLVNKKIILFVGNILPLKRLDLIIKSLKLIDDKEVVLLVVGDGVDLEKNKQMAISMGVASQVRFIGSCTDRAKLVGYYNAATCVVVPSDYESFSLVTIEAMACGKPLVLSNLPVFNKIKGAVFFEKGSESSLADALKKVLSLSQEDLRIISQNNRELSVKNFSWEGHIKKLKDVYVGI